MTAPKHDPNGDSGTAFPAEAPEELQGSSAVDAAPESPEPDAAPSDGEQQEEAAVSDEDHEDKLALDLEELSAKAQKAQEYLDLAQRTKADFENYRKRAARDAAAAQERGVAKVVKELLPAIDNLDRALDAALASSGEDGTQGLIDGIKLVHAEVLAALGRAGIERFSPEGQAFDPQSHEAVAQQPVEGADQGTVVEVYQRGYRLGDSVLRPARVVVAG
jgi:molecular chaperone GrpE